MSRKQRIRIAIGVWGCVAGMAVAVIGAILPMHFAIARIYPESTEASITALNNAIDISQVIFTSGVTIATAGLLVASIEGTKAFVGKPTSYES
ncbi:hypothetical protein KOR34_50440 [Posidoniimonas corsicana]|uniref:Uncharacterized protein n=1 Tax=Posidoniimonas corsicana TaxID=1938618 RepID=A0A5C5UYF7_9BACT|nr:hypothetical protein [Posidoniimonas corsicana]TWT30485.1 hypothetical protein KOR34_50440 [Posidoniimonas corsicana]